MRLRVSSQVDSHHTNPLYRCLIAEFLPEDLHFRIRAKPGCVADWIPKDSEILELVLKMLELSPTFIDKLRRILEERSHFRLRVPLHELM